jgi:type IV pilus modification protein PilV
MRKTLERSKRRRQSGFSLIELMIAMIVLAVGLLGGMVVIVTAVATNTRNRVDTAAVALAQSTMDRIIVLSSSSTAQSTQMTDCDGTVHVMTTTGAAAPGNGAPLTDIAGVANGNQVIDFSKDPVNGYQMFYKLCAAGATDGLPLGNPQLYDVRWNIQNITGSPYTQMVLVAAKNISILGNGFQTQTQYYNMPITLRAMRGN